MPCSKSMLPVNLINFSAAQLFLHAGQVGKFPGRQHFHSKFFFPGKYKNVQEAPSKNRKLDKIKLHKTKFKAIFIHIVLTTESHGAWPSVDAADYEYIFNCGYFLLLTTCQMTRHSTQFLLCVISVSCLCCFRMQEKNMQTRQKD